MVVAPHTGVKEGEDVIHGRHDVNEGIVGSRLRLQNTSSRVRLTLLNLRESGKRRRVRDEDAIKKSGVGGRDVIESARPEHLCAADGRGKPQKHMLRPLIEGTIGIVRECEGYRQDQASPSREAVPEWNQPLNVEVETAQEWFGLVSVGKEFIVTGGAMLDISKAAQIKTNNPTAALSGKRAVLPELVISLSSFDLKTKALLRGSELPDGEISPRRSAFSRCGEYRTN